MTVDNNHAQTIQRASYDPQTNVAYLTFCDCIISHTEDQSQSTSHALLYDWSENSSHVTGVEFLNYPHVIEKQKLLKDLSGSRLSEVQRNAVIQKML